MPHPTYVDADYFEVPPEPVDSGHAADGVDGLWAWQRIQGVYVEFPAGRGWSAQGVKDPCASDARYWLILENRPRGDRIKIEMATRRVLFDYGSDETLTEEVVARIRGSFDGDRVLRDVLKRVLPQPTSVTCDPAETDAIPTLVPDTFVPPPS